MKATIDLLENGILLRCYAWCSNGGGTSIRVGEWVHYERGGGSYDVNQSSFLSCNQSAMHVACEHANFEAMNWIFHNGGNGDVTKKNGCTYDMAQQLHKPVGRSPMSNALMSHGTRDPIPVMEWLSTHGAIEDVHKPVIDGPDLEKATPMYFAACGNLKTSHQLVDIERGTLYSSKTQRFN